MTYLELYEQANYELEHSLITLGEYEKRIKPLEEEVRQTGHWKRISPAKIYECSECGQNVMTDNIDCYKFCHCCGAKMKGD